MAVSNESDSDENKKNVTFRASEKLIDEFDDAIFRAKVDGEIPRDTKRSEILRKLMLEYIEDREK